MSDPVRWDLATLKAHMAQFPGGAEEFARKFNDMSGEEAVARVKRFNELDPQSKPRIPVAKSQPKRGSMNKIEAAYSVLLDELKIVGKVTGYKFESVTLKLADGCRYTPDFQVVTAGQPVGFHEVKSGRKRKSGNVGAFMEDDARVKLLTAAKLYPEFDFFLCWHYKGQWTIEQIAK